MFEQFLELLRQVSLRQAALTSQAQPVLPDAGAQRDFELMGGTARDPLGNAPEAQRKQLEKMRKWEEGSGRFPGTVPVSQEVQGRRLLDDGAAGLTPGLAEELLQEEKGFPSILDAFEKAGHSVFDGVPEEQHPMLEMSVNQMLQDRLDGTDNVDEAWRMGKLDPAFMDALGMDPELVDEFHRVAARESLRTYNSPAIRDMKAMGRDTQIPQWARVHPNDTMAYYKMLNERSNRDLLTSLKIDGEVRRDSGFGQVLRNAKSEPVDSAYDLNEQYSETNERTRPSERPGYKGYTRDLSDFGDTDGWWKLWGREDPESAWGPSRFNEMTSDELLALRKAVVEGETLGDVPFLVDRENVKGKPLFTSKNREIPYGNEILDEIDRALYDRTQQRAPLQLGPELNPSNRYHQEAFRGLLKQMTGGQDTTSLTARLAGLSQEDLLGVKAALADPSTTPTWYEVLGGDRLTSDMPFRIGDQHYFKNDPISDRNRQFLQDFIDDRISNTPPSATDRLKGRLGDRNQRGAIGSGRRLPSSGIGSIPDIERAWSAIQTITDMEAELPLTDSIEGPSGPMPNPDQMRAADSFRQDPGYQKANSYLKSWIERNEALLNQEGVMPNFVKNLNRGMFTDGEVADLLYQKIVSDPGLRGNRGDFLLDIQESRFAPRPRNQRGSVSFDRFVDFIRNRWKNDRNQRGAVGDDPMPLPNRASRKAGDDLLRRLDEIDRSLLKQAKGGVLDQLFASTTPELDEDAGRAWLAGNEAWDAYRLEGGTLYDGGTTGGWPAVGGRQSPAERSLETTIDQELFNDYAEEALARKINSPIWPVDPQRTALGITKTQDIKELAAIERLLSDPELYAEDLRLQPSMDANPWRYLNEELIPRGGELPDSYGIVGFGDRGDDISGFLSRNDPSAIDARDYWRGSRDVNSIYDSYFDRVTPYYDSESAQVFESLVKDLQSSAELERLETGVDPRTRIMAEAARDLNIPLNPKIPQHNDFAETLFKFMGGGEGGGPAPTDSLDLIDQVLAGNEQVMGGARTAMGAPLPGVLGRQTIFESPPDRPTGGPVMPPTNATRPAGANPFWFNNPPPVPPGVDTRQFLNDWLTQNRATPVERARFFANDGPGGRVLAADPFYAAERLRNAGVYPSGDVLGPNTRARLAGRRGYGFEAGDAMDMGPTRMGGGEPFPGGSTVPPERFNRTWQPSDGAAPDPIRLGVEQGRTPPGTSPGTWSPFEPPASPLTPPPYNPTPPPYRPTPPPYRPTPPPYRPTPPPYRPTPPPYNPTPPPVAPPPVAPPPVGPIFRGPTANGELLPSASNARYVEPLFNQMAQAGGSWAGDYSPTTPKRGLLSQAKNALFGQGALWGNSRVPGLSQLGRKFPIGTNIGVGLAGGAVGSFAAGALDESDWLGGKDSFANDAASKMLRWGGAGAGFGPWGALAGAAIGLGHEGLERVGVLGDGSQADDGTLVQDIYNSGLRAGVPRDDLDGYLRQYNDMLGFADSATDPDAFKQQLTDAFRQSVMGKYSELTTPGDGTSPEEQEALALAIQAQIGAMAQPYANQMLRDADNVAAGYDQVAANDPAMAPFARQAADYARYTASRDATNYITAQGLSPMYQALMKQAGYFNSAASSLQQSMMGSTNSSSTPGLEEMLAQYRQGALAGA
jgi:hypothetical protein